jgi:chromate reductase, NAD(P)H dehydrogenase (quinone)
MKLLGIAGSLRKESYNLGALRSLATVLSPDIAFDIADLAELPFYSADLEQAGMPDSVQRFRARVAAADALIFAVPEYNFSIPGVLKNALEWLSRPPSSPADGKPCAIFGASVSPLGTARGQFHFRHVAVSLNMMMVNVPHVDITNAKAKFDASSRLLDQPSFDSLQKLVEELRALVLLRKRSAPAHVD